MRKGFWLFGVLLIAITALLLTACPPKQVAPPVPVLEIRLGSLNDTTGPTSDVGKDVFIGIQEAVAYYNDMGGIGGKRIKLFQYDYGYRIPEAITTYKRFRDFDKVHMVLGWGTGDTEALSPTITMDRIAFLSNSLSNHLCDPKKTPYNFIYGSDYSGNARAALQAWYEEFWLKDPRYKAEREAGVKPRLGLFYAWPVPYATAPIPSIKDHAKLLGFELVPDQDVPLTALDTKTQWLAVKPHRPHLVWHGNTTMSTAVAIRDAYALKIEAAPGVPVMHIINNWGYDENLPRIAGLPAVEGTAIGIAVCAFFGMDVPMMDKVIEYCKKLNPGIPLERRLIRTVQAWLQVGMAVEALNRADEMIKKEFGKCLATIDLATARVKIKEAFETFREVDFGLGAPKKTITPYDHRPNSDIDLYIVKGGKFVHLTRIDLAKKFPDLWPKWLGW